MLIACLKYCDKLHCFRLGGLERTVEGNRNCYTVGRGGENMLCLQYISPSKLEESMHCI